MSTATKTPVRKTRTAPAVPIGRRIRVRGTVQGVGFRPWVYRLAQRDGLRGSVRNDAAGVTIEAWGDEDTLDAFCAALESSPPPAAAVRDVAWRELDCLEPAADDAFVIVGSAAADERRLSIPPDLATCDECLAEIDAADHRRHGYAFTNCTNCGPRFTIALDVPYDRPATTMAGFALCGECAREYSDPLDRRFHAQPNACPVCGPRLWLEDPTSDPLSSKHPFDNAKAHDKRALEEAADALLRGRIVAVKGLGGFHLACRADDEAAVQELRRRKGRGREARQKPFAVMVRNLEEARRLAHVGDGEARLLTAVERPIVLLRRRLTTAPPVAAPPVAAPPVAGPPPAPVSLAASVAPEIHIVGLMLPYTPLHHLLLAAVKHPLVMTSGNVSEEPIAFDNDEARRRLGAVADLFLVHDRPIARPCDDSVVRVVAGVPTLLRRSRGWVPRAIPVPRPFPRPVLACGGHLKNVVCLGVGDSAYLGPHVGNLESPEAVDFLAQSAAELETLLGVTPEIVVHDLHPDYESTHYARRRAAALGVPCVGVQHHHAHVLAAMAEHGADPVDGHELLGLVFDGTGWGPDGTAWGGEILHVHRRGFRRLATLRPLALAGGESAIRQPWRLALALLDDAYDGAPPLDRLELFNHRSRREITTLRQMAARGVNAPLAHGAGRYFDAVGALLTAIPTAGYEGHLALRLESLADAAGDSATASPWPWVLERRPDPASQGSRLEIDLRPALRRLVRRLLDGVSPATLAARFHATLASAAADALRRVSEAEALAGLPVALTGGCFQNHCLTERVEHELAGRRILRHRQAPPGDGGLALGQAMYSLLSDDLSHDIPHDDERSRPCA